MKAQVNSKTGLPEWSLDEKDFEDARLIKEIMAMPGWKRLKEYQVVCREAIIEALKKRPATDVEVRKTALLGQMLNGWDDCAILADKIVVRADDYLEKQRNEQKEVKEEQLHATNDDD